MTTNPLSFRPLTTYEAKVISFMAARDYTRGHADTLNSVEAIWDEIVAEAGPNGRFCPFLEDKLKVLAADREDVILRAVERYEDWASD